MPITAPAVGDPTKQTLIQSIIDALAAAEVDIAAIVGERLVTNGSFEVDSDSDGFPDQWTRTLYTGGAFALVDDTGTGANSAHGLKAIKFTHPGGAGKGGGEIVTHADTYIEASPNRPYLLTWQNKNSVAGVTNSVEVIEYDATQTNLSTQVIFSATSNPTTWTLMRSRFMPADPLTRYIKIRFKCGETSASTAGTIFIDNVQLSAAAFSNVYRTSDIEMDATGIPESVIGKWVAPTGVYAAEVEVIGGGGGGGAGSGANGGCGGGGGGYAKAICPCTPGTAYAFTLGKGDLGGVGTLGANGDSTTITIGAITLTGGGGAGGAYGLGAGGGGGVGSGGTTNLNGVDGVSNAGGTPGMDGGYCPAIGFAGIGGTVADVPGTPALGAGGGGGGGAREVGGGVTADGGAGRCGAIIIRW